LAFTIEYQAVVLAAGLSLAFLTIASNRRVGPLIAFGVGMALPVFMVFAYNMYAFGNPLMTSYGHLHHESVQASHRAGLFGITLPTVTSVYGLLFSPARGLLICAPLIVLGIAALALVWRRARWLAVYTATSFAAYFMLVAGGDGFWFGGWSFGPRLLVPIFSIASVGGAMMYQIAEDRGGAVAAVFRAVFVFSIVYNVFVFTMFPELPPKFTSPLMSVALPLAQLNTPSPNLGMLLLGLEGMNSLIPLYILIACACVYVALGTELRHQPRPLPILAFLIVLSMSFIYVAGYPETYNAKKVEKFVELASAMRTDAQ